MTAFAKEVNPGLGKRPLKTNGRLANLELTSSVKEARQPAVVPQPGGSEFDPHWVHGNLSIPLWVYMRFCMPELQNEIYIYIYIHTYTHKHVYNKSSFDGAVSDSASISF